jgi:hypothetical protein
MREYSGDNATQCGDIQETMQHNEGIFRRQCNTMREYSGDKATQCGNIQETMQHDAGIFR